ncbi:hypothetical protein [Serratia marcescens]|uniref:hypothetical protein n=1 Tax=Serratia marcescens TaxID=615 RepID=UPI00148C4EE1|nr:hypothetical protein [Serratia marcescens]QJU42288.1 hypothetical protein HMI62_24530 [Serratia marcescens]
METKARVRIDTQDNYLSESLKRVMKSRCQGHFSLGFISKEDNLQTPSVIITHEIRTITPKKIFPNSYGQPVVVQLRDKGGNFPVVLHSCALQGLCIFRDDTVDTVSSVCSGIVNLVT